MTINIKKLKKNGLFFIVCIVLIVVLSLLSFLVDKNGISLDKEDLNDKDIDINSLVINEIVTSNNGIITDNEGNLYDYIEIYNGSDEDINLKNYGLSDEEQKVKWTFPDMIVKAKGYLVVSLSGNKNNVLNASFKLKSSGNEVVTLFKPNGKVIDAIQTVALESNTCMARNENGTWVIQDKPTPGFANNVEGHTAFINSLLSNDDKTIVINEILAENKGNFKNNNNEYSGYIEIKNVSNETIDITNYSISNSEDVSFKWQFPSMKLKSGEVKVVYTSGISRKDGELNSSFKLKNKDGVVVLTNNKGKVIDKVEYNNLANGVAYIKQGDSFFSSNSISPGYQNNVDGIKEFQKKYLVNPSDLIINEVMNSNYSYLAQNGGNYYDWIELYNNSDKSISLKSYCLTTTTNNMCMYNLPDITLEKGKYYVIMASGDENLSNDKYKHANFKISDTESIYLTKSNEVIDAMLITNVPNGYSYGKGSKYGNYYFSKPTPNAKNSSGVEAVSYLPSASIKSGTYEDSISVTLNGYGNIYYTLDGSMPKESSKVYSSPLTIKKTTVLRIMSKESGKIKSETITYSYIMNENHNVAIMSIAINPSDLNNVNSHTSLNSTVIEPCDVELIEKDGSGFKIGAGLKLFGGSTRSYKKKSYEIKFKKEFGDSELNYKVFENVDSSVFNSLVLRTGSQDEFQYNDQRTVIKDVVATSIMGENTNVDVQDYKSIILYINGNYNGIYFIREKVDENFIANHYNVNATKYNTDILRIDGEVKIGSSNKYNSMMNFINNNSLSNTSNYNKIKEQVDIENLCDFWIAEMWTANYDILNVRYFSNPDIDNGKWKFIFYDLDSGFFRTTNNSYIEYTNASGMGAWNFSTALLRNLMKNSEFKKTFLERLSYNLENTWTYENVSKKIDEIINEFGNDEFKRNAERWENSYSKWNTSIERMKTFAKNRNSYMIKQAKSYFNLTDSEVKKYFGSVI
ncbi:MAG: lamin tail domain-containing protein [Bacilli bacterium]